MVKVIVQAVGIRLAATLGEEALPDLIELIKQHRLDGSTEAVSDSDGGDGSAARSGALNIEEVDADVLLNRADWSNMAEKILLFGAWLEQRNGQQAWKVEHLREVFDSAREPLPANVPRDLQRAVRSGWLHQDASRNYRVTREGLGKVKRMVQTNMI